jgi:hypothetical protein
MGSKLLPKPLIEARDLDGLHDLIAATVAAVAEARN